MTRNHRGRHGHIAGFDAEFYAHHLPHLRKRLLRMGFVDADVDDLVQHTFIVAQDSWNARPRRRSRQRSWLEGIAWRLGMNLLRCKQHRHEQLESESLDAFVGDDLDLEDLIDARRMYTAAMAELLAEDRQMLLDYYVDEMPLTEIATRHGLARSTAWSRLQKLRKEAATKIGIRM